MGRTAFLQERTLLATPRSPLSEWAPLQSFDLRFLPACIGLPASLLRHQSRWTRESMPGKPSGGTLPRRMNPSFFCLILAVVAGTCPLLNRSLCAFSISAIKTTSSSRSEVCTSGQILFGNLSSARRGPFQYHCIWRAKTSSAASN